MAERLGALWLFAGHCSSFSFIVFMFMQRQLLCLSHSITEEERKKQKQLEINIHACICAAQTHHIQICFLHHQDKVQDTKEGGGCNQIMIRYG